MPFSISSIDRPCNEVLSNIRQALALAGLRSLETFDLQAARLRAYDCVCPRHGSASCDCQMVVLLIYGAAVALATLILHGSEGQTSLAMPDDALRPLDPVAAAAIEDGIRKMLAAHGGQ